MKILIIGDVHLRFELPYSSVFSDGRRDEWKAVQESMYKEAKNCDAVMFLGDFYNSRHNHSSVIKDSISFLKAFGDKEIHIISGNHCRYGTSTALDFLQRLGRKNWHIHTEPEQVSIAGLQAMMVPYMTPALLEVATKEEGVVELVSRFPKQKIPLAFMHHAVESSMINELIMGLPEIVIPDASLSVFGHTFFGHIHTSQKVSDTVIGTGNVFTQEVGEHEKSIWTYEDGKVEEIKLPVRGIYKVMFSGNDSGFFDLGSIPSASIVKAIITDRGVVLEEVKEALKRFNASMIIEQYPSTRTKFHFEDGGIDLSIEGLLKLYAEEKKLSYAELIEGYELIK